MMTPREQELTTALTDAKWALMELYDWTAFHLSATNCNYVERKLERIRAVLRGEK